MSEITKTKEELRADWIAALRSGEYEQGRGNLIRKDGEKSLYCCLGVAGRLIGITDKELIEGDSDPYRTIKEAYGLHADLGHPKNKDDFTPLYILNDSYKKTFTEIANVIEQNPDQYFE